MKPEIKERIEKIKRGEVPEGYKKIKRFLLPIDWKVEKLGNLVEKIVGGGTPSRKNDEYYNGNIPWVTVKDLSEDNYKSETVEYITQAGLENSSTKLIEEGCFIISTRMGLGKGFINKVPMAINQDLKGIYPIKEKLNVEFLMYWYKFMSKYIEYLGGGSTVKGIDLDTLRSLELRIMRHHEQQKIAEILSTWDKAIELKEKLIEEKKKQKKGLMQLLLTGKKRLPGFKGKIAIKKLKDYIKESKARNKDCKVTTVLSVSNKQGFILQQEQFDRVVASKDLSKYKIIVKNQFAYNPSRVNVGSIDLLKNFDKGVLSPMYIVFECKEGLYTEYLYQFLKSSMFINYIPKLLQGSVRNSLSFKALGMVKLFIPTIEEQKAIANVLSTIDKEIELLEQELETLKLQKKGLMQLLLTGIVRVTDN